MTIEKLAHAACVSAPTIYSLFQSKRGVLGALMDETLRTDEYKNLLIDVCKKGTTARERLVIAAKISRLMYDTERAQIDLLRGASVVAPELKELEREREERRYQRQEESIRTTAEEGDLINGLSFTEARDILWAFTGRDLYRMLVIERHWSSDAYEK